MGPLRVLLCEPYFTGSHRSWAEELARHSAHDVAFVTHTGGFWKWRMQGAALTLAADVGKLVARWERPDVLLVSDMVHLPALLGFARATLAGIPVVLYMHENQLTYPARDDAPPDHTYAMTNWLSMAVADRVVFNSEHHRADLFAALPGLLRRFPDHRHLDHLERVHQASCVLPVGVHVDRFSLDRRPHDPPVVLWNHRWEYDKDPEAFFAALVEVAARGIAFRVIIAGESFQAVPDAFDAGRRALGDRVIHFGTATDDEYPDLLAQADVVVSTARHDFFGVAVVEAIAAGALPLLPARLSYRELVPGPDPFLYGTGDQLVERLCWALTRHDERTVAARRARTYIERFGWPVVAREYDTLLTATASAGADERGHTTSRTPNREARA